MFQLIIIIMFLSPSAVITNKCSRKLLLPDDVIAVTVLKRQNGVAAQMAHEHCVMPAAYTMRS